MCTITINPSSISAVPLGPGMEAQVSVSGTVANCTSNAVTVTVSCPTTTGAMPAVISGTTWTATVPSKCRCGSAITITATCNDTPPCSASLNMTLICNCCPQLSTDPICPPQYLTSGPALIKFVTRVTLPAGCNPVTVQRDFGDGAFGATQTYTAGQNTYTETHAYATGAVYTFDGQRALPRVLYAGRHDGVDSAAAALRNEQLRRRDLRRVRVPLSA